MKVMYLLFSFTIGGTERLIVNICNEVIYRADVHLFIINDLIDDDLLNTLDSRIYIQLLKRKVGSSDKILPIIKIAKYIKKNKIDIVHCNSFNAPELLILSKIINPKCKIISTIHGMGQFKGISKFRIDLKNFICNQFIAISDSVKEDIIKAGIPERKVIRIYNGIDITKYRYAKYKLFNKEKIVIGCVARIMPTVKGQDILLKAINVLKHKYPNILVLFAGNIAKTQQEDYKKLLNYIKDNNLYSNVIFLENINDVPKFLNNIDICVVPSRSEGFGLALIEAMSMGVPCIASNIAGPKEIVLNENIGLLFENGDFQDLALKIEETLLKFDKIKMQAWNKKESIKEKYSIKDMCIRLLDVYNA